jgi:hypothetical protein
VDEAAKTLMLHIENCSFANCRRNLSRQVDTVLVVGQFTVDDQTERNLTGLLKCLVDVRAQDQWDALVVGNVELGVWHVGSHKHRVLFGCETKVQS